MKNKKGFVISTTLYSIFGIMLIVIFYILYMLSNNRMLLTTSTNELKSELESKATTLDAYGVDKYPDTIGALAVEVKQEKGIEEIKYIYDFYDQTTHTTNYMKNHTTATTYCSNSDSDTSNDCNTENKIDLDVLDTGYKGCTTKIAYKNNFNCLIADSESMRQGYSKGALNNKSYIFYIKDSLNQESIYLVTPKVKIERTGGMITTKNTLVYNTLDNNQILIRAGTQGSHYSLTIANFLSPHSNIEQWFGVDVEPQLGSIKATDEYIYFSLWNRNSSVSRTYAKAARYGEQPSNGIYGTGVLGNNTITITQEEYDSITNTASYTSSNNPIEHPILGNTSEKIKMAFYQFGETTTSNTTSNDAYYGERCTYGYYEDGSYHFSSGTHQNHSALNSIIYGSLIEEDKYVFFNNCKSKSETHHTCYTYFETKPEVVVTKK